MTHNTNSLKKEINELKYMIEHTSSKSVKRHYSIIYLNLCDLLYEITDEVINTNFLDGNLRFIGKYIDNINKNFYNEISTDNYVKMINKLTKNTLNFLKPIHKYFYFDSNINLNDAKDLIIEFICNYDISLYPIVTKALNDEHLFIIYEKNEAGNGYTFFNTYSSSPYIVIFTNSHEKKLSIENITCLMHEIGHVINFYMNLTNPKMFIKTTHNSFVETPSIIFEELFIEYLVKNKIEEENIQMIKHNNLYLLKQYSSYLRLNNFIINDIFECEEVDLDEIKEILLSKGINKDIDYLKYSFNDVLANYQYNYGHLISSYYLDLFNKDEETTKKYIKEFIKCIGITDDFYMLNHFGIDFDKFIQCDYLNDIVSNNQKQLSHYKR